MLRKLLLPIALIATVGCSNSGGILLADAGPDAETGSDSVAPRQDVTSDSLPSADGVAPGDSLDLSFEELATPDGGPLCAPGEGCFLDPCSENSDCQSGWCVLHMGQSVCSQACSEECPAGWSCKQVGGTDPDIVYVCVSNVANLCKPCAGGADCHSPTGVADACIVLPGEGSFCGGACDDGECPLGFACEAVETIDGVALEQCVPKAGSCPCTDTSVALGLWTPCGEENQFGSCAGKRVCTADGLSPCDAAVAVPESCNGIDDDCDGDVDEPSLLEGNFVSLCEDDNDCTKDSCLGGDGCANAALNEGECADGNPCTVADHCVAGLCVGQPVDCDDNNPCTDDFCGEAGGCQYEANNIDCDDGDPCTVADECNDGACTGTGVDCECLTDGDCAALEDGDLCNGTLVCNTSSLPHLCVVDPATPVTCPDPTGINAICQKGVCDPATGACGFVADHEALLCEDGDPCTVNDKCLAGTCMAGVAANCSDGNPCTDDGCEAGIGCTHTFNAKSCDDGNGCTLGDTCSNGACAAGVALGCDDANPCTDDGCDPDTGCTHAANNGACDDANACTANDICAAGVCTAGSGVFCDDDNPCTSDWCDPLDGCVHKLNEAPCSDGDICTVDDHCHLGACISSTSLQCNDGNLCTDDSCDGAVGCQFVPNAAACDDGNACTTGDQCSDGQCKSTALLECDDDNPCTSDACVPGAGCTYSNNSAPCSDGSICTASDICAGGVCEAGPQLDCDDQNPCTDDFCDALAGCQHLSNQVLCSDGNVCTVGDQCQAGKCVPGALNDCDDVEPCTDDSCHPLDGCQHVANALECEDGNQCTTGDFCAGGTCVAGAAVNCDDGQGCTADSCAPEAGCQHLPDHAACDDSDVCTTDSCELAEGCLHVTVADCCGNGIVEAGEACDDGNHLSGDGCSSSCQVEPYNCSAGGAKVSVAPSGTMMICKDPGYNTCEQDMGNLCPSGWHLCSYQEFNHRNDGWNHTSTTSHRALGVIYCRNGGGAGHYTVPDAPHGNWNMGQDEQLNCYYGSSRPECTAGYGCNEKQSEALCCAPGPSCGNGKIDSPEEACDDGNNSNSDACLNNCTLRTPGGGGTNC